MGGSSLKNESLRESSIDRAGMLLLPHEDAIQGWLLSTSTPIVSKMNLSKPLPPPPSCSKGTLHHRTPTRVVPCQPSFNQPHYNLSIASESSDSGLVEDPPCWFGSDTTVEDHNASETEIWNSYFWSQDKSNLRSYFHQVDQKAGPPFRNQDSNLSPDNRNFASSNLSGLNINEFLPELERSDAIRTPRRTPKSLPRNTYSPFPAVSPSPIQSSESAHKSWQLRSDSQSQPQRRPHFRSRAHTIPTDCTPLLPSNLSTCSTLDDRSLSHSSTSSASGLYVRSARVSPDFAPPLMDFMEKSYFDTDSDVEESTLAALATRLHIRSASSNSPGLCGDKGRLLRSQKSRKNLRIAGDAIKGVFGIRTSSNAV